MKKISHPDILDLTYHAVTKRVQFTVKKGAQIILADGLAKMFDFEPNTKITSYHTNIDTVEEISYVAEPKGTFTVIYVYCDLMEPQIVGDIQAPSSKIVTMEGRDGEMANAHYPPPLLHTCEPTTFSNDSSGCKNDSLVN